LPFARDASHPHFMKLDLLRNAQARSATMPAIGADRHSSRDARLSGAHVATGIRKWSGVVVPPA